MLELLSAITVTLVILVVAMQVWRWLDIRETRATWAKLGALQAAHPAVFADELLAELPEPAARFFRFTIAPGTPLSMATEIVMRGEIAFGTTPGYQPIRAQQILAPPEGLVWRLAGGSGLLRISGSDAMVGDRSWTRFWLLHLFPVVRAGANSDHLRASFGRVIAEAAFWAPAALLPQTGTTWEAVDADTARATVRHRSMTQTVDVHVNEAGQPIWVAIPRWSNANPEKEYRLQPFGGTLSDFRDVQGYRLPFRVEGGNFFGTKGYFPFYRATVRTIRPLPRG